MALQRRTSADSSVSRTISRELCSKLHETPFKTIAQTLTLASSPAEDYIQDRSRNIQCANCFEQPSYLHSLLDNYIPSRNLRSEGLHLRIPFRKTAAPTIRNSLNSSTRGTTSIGAFKTRLKTKLFLWAFQ